MASSAQGPTSTTTAEAYATMPTRRTLFLRTFLPWQVIRFIVINVKMLRMAFRH